MAARQRVRERKNQQTAEGGKEEAAGGSSEQGKRPTGARPPPNRRRPGGAMAGQGVRHVQRGRLPVPGTADRPADGGPAGGGSGARGQRATHDRRGPPKQNRVRFGAGSAAPCQARRPAGRGVWERRTWRAGWLPQQPAEERGRIFAFYVVRPLPRGCGGGRAGDRRAAGRAHRRSAATP
jgi:hypothetical protein